MQGFIIERTGYKIHRDQFQLSTGSSWKCLKLPQAVRMGDNLGIPPFVKANIFRTVPLPRVYLTNLEDTSRRLLSQVTGVENLVMPELPVELGIQNIDRLALQGWVLEKGGPILNYALAGTVGESPATAKEGFVYLFQGFPHAEGVAQTFGVEPFPVPNAGVICQPDLWDTGPEGRLGKEPRQRRLINLQVIGGKREAQVGFSPFQWIVAGRMIHQFPGWELSRELFDKSRVKRLEEEQEIKPTFVIETPEELGTDREVVFSATTGNLKVFGPVVGLDILDPTKVFAYFYAERAKQEQPH